MLDCKLECVSGTVIGSTELGKIDNYLGCYSNNTLYL